MTSSQQYFHIIGVLKELKEDSRGSFFVVIEARKRDKSALQILFFLTKLENKEKSMLFGQVIL